MNISRRKALAFGGAALTVTLVPVSFAQAASEEVMKAAVDAFTGGAAIAEGGIELTTPEIGKRQYRSCCNLCTRRKARYLAGQRQPEPGCG